MTENLSSRRRWRWLSIMAAINLAAVGLVAVPSQAQQVSLCSGTAENLTIAGDLAVPAGASCDLVNVTVTGNVAVRVDANLALEDSAVQGNLTVRGNGFAHVATSAVEGEVLARQAFGLTADDAELTGGVDARNTGFVLTEQTRHGGVFSGHGQTVVIGGWVDGDLRTNQDLLTDVDDTVVTGQLVVNAAESGSVVCRSEIDGDTILRNNQELVQVSGDTPVPDCEFNVFGSRLVLRSNDGEVQVSGNVVRENLACHENAAAPTGADNRLRGQATGQCADLAPAGPALGLAAAPVTLDSRTASIRAQVETRSAAAVAAVAQAGPAGL